MAVAETAVVNVSPGTGTDTGASPSISTPATNPVVMVSICFSGNGTTVTSLTITGFGGTAAKVVTVLDSVFGGFPNAEIWKITAPSASTSGTVKANFSASADFSMAVIAYSGADQTDPSPNADAVSNAAPSQPITLTPANLTANDATIGNGANAQFQDIENITPNDRYTQNTGAINQTTGDNFGTTGVTFPGGTSAGNIVVCAARIKAAGGAAANAVSRSINPGPLAMGGFVGQ